MTDHEWKMVKIFAALVVCTVVGSLLATGVFGAVPDLKLPQVGVPLLTAVAYTLGKLLPQAEIAIPPPPPEPRPPIPEVPSDEPTPRPKGLPARKPRV